MSLYQTVSQTPTNTERIEPTRLRLLATVSSSRPNLNLVVSDGIKINGRLGNGQVTLEAKLSQAADCLSGYICEIEELDSRDETMMTSYRLLPQPDQDTENV
ncbi:hypothetical protein ElyMa_002919800, partial [Elysia marginata]